MWNVVVFIALFGGTATFAMIKGGAPERVAASILLVAALADFTLVSIVSSPLGDRNASILVLDLATAIAVIVVALHAERLWPMPMASFLIVGVQLQLGVWLAPVHHRQVYVVAHAFSAYPVIALLIAGTFRHMRRVRSGRELAWTWSARKENDERAKG